MTFDEWYATQKHQLSNESVCRTIWDAAQREMKIDNKRLSDEVSDLRGFIDGMRPHVLTAAAMYGSHPKPSEKQP